VGAASISGRSSTPPRRRGDEYSPAELTEGILARGAQRGGGGEATRLPPRRSEAERPDEARLELGLLAGDVELALLELLLELVGRELVDGGHVHGVAARGRRRGLLLGDGLGLALLAAAGRLLGLLGRLGGRLLRLGLVEVRDCGARGPGVLLQRARLVLQVRERVRLAVGALARRGGLPRGRFRRDLGLGLGAGGRLGLLARLVDRRLLIPGLLDRDGRDEALGLRLGLGLLGGPRLRGGLGLGLGLGEGRGALRGLLLSLLAGLRRNRPVMRCAIVVNRTPLQTFSSSALRFAAAACSFAAASAWDLARACASSARVFRAAASASASAACRFLRRSSSAFAVASASLRARASAAARALAAAAFCASARARASTAGSMRGDDTAGAGGLGAGGLGAGGLGAGGLGAGGLGAGGCGGLAAGAAMGGTYGGGAAGRITAGGAPPILATLGDGGTMGAPPPPRVGDRGLLGGWLSMFAAWV